MTLSDPLPIAPRADALRLTIRPPGSKSITCRAYLLAALAEGTSRLGRPLRSADTDAMLAALVTLGAEATWTGDDVAIRGVGGIFPRGGDIDLGDGGTPSRFLLAAACLGHHPVRVTGSAQMRRRPVGEGVDLLRRIGGDLTYLEAEGHLPVLVRPTDDLNGGDLDVPTTLSSQFISALMLVAPWLPGGLRLRYTGPLTSAPYVALTRAVLRRFGINASGDAHGDTVRVTALNGCAMAIEADASSAAYWFLAGALSPGGAVTVRGLDTTSIQADMGVAHALASMGATVSDDADSITVRGPTRLAAIDCDCAGFPDGALALAIAASRAQGVSTLRGLRTLKYKESDRLAALCTELDRVGVRATAAEDTLTIEGPGPFSGEAVIETYDDHRMAMAFAILGLSRPGIAIRNPACVGKSYPGFWEDLEKVVG